MKNSKIIVLFVLLSALALSGTAKAANPSISVSPAALTKNAGDVFSLSAEINASGSKVCAVEGTLVFNNLSCQSITVADGVTAQSAPSCSNPHFLLGIQSCVASTKALLSVSVKAGSAGEASVSFTGVDIIGEGSSLGSASTNGNYTINAAATASTSTPQISTQPTQPKTSPKTATQPAQPEETVTSEQNENSVQQPLAESQEQPEQARPFLADIGSLITLGTGNSIVGIIVVLILAAVIAYGFFYFQKKRKPQQ